MKNIIILTLVLAILALGYFAYNKNESEHEAVAYTSDLFVFASEGSQFTVQYDQEGNHAKVSLSGVQYELDRAISGSGTRYESEDGDVVFSEHQGEATLEIGGQAKLTGELLEEGESSLLTFNVGPERMTCTGEMEMECLIVNGEYFYDEIAGFEFEPGFEYVLRVERISKDNVPMDASSYEYNLVEVEEKRLVANNTSTSSLKTMDPTGTTWTYDGGNLSFTDGNYGMSFGCNSMGGTYTIANGEINFSETISTMMGCQEPIATKEANFARLIAEMKVFRETADGAQLEGNNKTMVLESI